ncbi:DNA-binding protein [Lentilactobacillus sp. Marseille-Q4993]|uniref:DNA-binding protein n=1 Tax=Lentilactobacillus sp. Marseille-Q4993 TaxID=3039492 RepID=UPI0024BCD34E|nr:DNA-binding protein [Lentilactobacillus sp. Marseille-Q4993]
MEQAVEPRYLSYKQAMKYMGIGSYNTLHKFIDLGLKVTMTPAGALIDKHDIDSFLASYKK